MSFDILGKDIAVLFILAVIFGIATYFYVLHKGKKEKRTASAEDKIILGFEVLAFSFTFFIFFPLVVEDVFDASGSNAKVVAIEPMGDGIKIVAKRNTMRVVFVPEDFFKYSLMKDMDGLSNEEKTIRYKRKANRMLGAVISFIPRDVGYFTDDFGTRIPFAVGSRADALAQLQNRYFFRATPQTRVEVGSTTTASVLSCGPRYVIVEAFGVEVSMGTGALSAFEYIEDASKSFKVGMGIPVAVEALEVDARAKTVNIRVSHSLLERMSAKVEGVSESMIGGRYLATIVNVTDKYYHVVLDGLKIRGVIPKTQNISNEMLMIGDKVSMLVRYINKEQALVIGGGHKN